MKDTKSDKYIHKPLKIIQDKRLTAREQDYLCLIASLQSKQGCTASNRYFAEYFGVSSSRAAEVIRSLKKKKFIKTNMEKKGRRTLKRTISVTDTDSRTALEIAGKKSPVRGGKKSPAKVVRIPRTGGKESPVGGGKESPAPIINNNNKYNNKEIEGAFAKSFTLKEVEDKAFICGVSQKDAEDFYHHYNSQGWLKGNGNPITNLRSQLIRWKRQKHREEFKNESDRRNNRSQQPAFR